MICPKCESDMRIMVQVTMSIPSHMEMNLSKKNISKKEVTIWGANWSAADHICTKCNYVFQGLKTYIQTLESKIKELENNK